MWRTIVLIDEADIFLEERKAGGHDSAKQDGLVASKSLHKEGWASEFFMRSNI